jgi:hypothetical protein
MHEVRGRLKIEKARVQAAQSFHGIGRYNTRCLQRLQPGAVLLGSAVDDDGGDCGDLLGGVLGRLRPEMPAITLRAVGSLETLEHDVQAHQSVFGVVERLRNCADDLEAE